MTAAKCNICGRFRSWEDVITVDYSNYPYAGEELVEECKTCTAPANLRYLKEATDD